MATITRLLIANRGEIAVRVIRACRELGIESVSVYSEADAEAPHAVLADRSIAIGASPASDSYLSIAKLIDAARSAGADGVHPGYGFLAENAEFARACADAGLVFVGPPADVIEQMGSKVAARRAMTRAGVPVVPGSEPADQSADGIRAAAEAAGYPILLKASAGGGGKGMRVVTAPPQLDDAVESARREALSAFGDGTLYVERLVARPRHVEVQVMADQAGHVVHLFERECSVQRRHQKVIEESPSTALTADLRARMGEAAVAAARAVGYVNAGTIEFLLEGTGDQARFYFLEMNTRLQVEHPVTEAVSGVDLVRAQIAVASGHALPWRQEEFVQRGHAIECRVYAEDASSGFLPQAGRLLLYREPSGPGIRVDSGVVEGSEVPVHYDPLLAKLIAHGETREAARRRAVAALGRFPILGVVTNVAFLRRVLAHPRFCQGEIDTGFIDAEIDALVPHPGADIERRALVAAAALAGASVSGGRASDRASQRPAVDPWHALGTWGRRP